MTELGYPGTGVFVLAGVVDDFGNALRCIDLPYDTYMARYWWFHQDWRYV